MPQRPRPMSRNSVSEEGRGRGVNGVSEGATAKKRAAAMTAWQGYCDGTHPMGPHGLATADQSPCEPTHLSHSEPMSRVTSLRGAPVSIGRRKC